MKRLLPTLLIALFFLPSCMGSRARNNVLMPAALSAWPEVRFDFERGLEDGVEDGDIDDQEMSEYLDEADELGEALERKDLFQLSSVEFEEDIRPWASRGIQAALSSGEIGPNGALVLSERLANFSAVILVLQNRTPALLSNSR